jgi:hypothetical protein
MFRRLRRALAAQLRGASSSTGAMLDERFAQRLRSQDSESLRSALA